MQTKDLFEFDLKYSPQVIGGVDEAGRGPLAGPVVCACCVMPMSNFLDKINDSKKLTEKLRIELYTRIRETALDYCIFSADNNYIDKVNILNATKYAMNNAVAGIKKIKPGLILVDAVKGLDIEYKYLPIIKGDAQSYNIAAASILAKEFRDKLMREADSAFPEYGFIRNKGYATEEHIAALKKYGATPLHRKTFIKNFFAQDVQLAFKV